MAMRSRPASRMPRGCRTARRRRTATAAADADAPADAEALGAAVGIGVGDGAGGRRPIGSVLISKKPSLVSTTDASRPLSTKTCRDLVGGHVRVLEAELPLRSAGVVDRELEARLPAGEDGVRRMKIRPGIVMSAEKRKYQRRLPMMSNTPRLAPE